MSQPSDQPERVPPPQSASLPKSKSVPEAMWVPPPSTPNLQLASPPRGSGYLAGAVIGFVLAATAAILVWLLLPEGTTRQQPAPNRDAAKTSPTTSPARPNERTQELEKQFADLQKKHDELARERDLLLAAKDLAEQQLTALNKSLEAAKQKSPPRTGPEIVQLTHERDVLKAALESIARELKTAPPEALQALLQLRAAQKQLAAEKEELLARLKAQAPTILPPLSLPSTVSSSATARQDSVSAIPLLPGNSWAGPPPAPNPTTGSPLGSGAQRSDTAPLAATSALGGQPMRIPSSTTRTPAARTGIGY